MGYREFESGPMGVDITLKYWNVLSLCIFQRDTFLVVGVVVFDFKIIYSLHATPKKFKHYNRPTLADFLQLLEHVFQSFNQYGSWTPRSKQNKQSEDARRKKRHSQVEGSE